jgi:LysW-gamma-L-lysine carboxypeptidase
MFDQLLPSLREMHSHSDGFTETAQLKFNLRVPLSLGREDIAVAVGALTDDAVSQLVEFTPAYRAGKNTPLVRAFLAAIRAEGVTPGFTMKSGTSDMNLVAPAWKCPAVAYGPGDSNLDHTPDEHILVSEYLRGISVLAEVLRTL